MKYLNEDGTLYLWQKIKTALNLKANTSDIPTKTSDLTNNSGFITSTDIVNKADKSELFSGSYNDLTNKPTIDSSMSESSTNAIQNKVVKSYIDSSIGSITGISFEIVTELPTVGVVGKIYLLSNGGSNSNCYDEYIWLLTETRFEKIGTTDVDLSGYVKATELSYISNSEIDTIVAS